MPKIRKGVKLPVLGLDLSAPAELINDRSLADVRNVEINRNQLIKRCGTVDLGDPLGEKILGFGDLKVGTTHYIIRVGTTKVQGTESDF